MADSRIMRRSARLFLSGVFHAKDAVERLPIKDSMNNLPKQLSRFSTIFNEEFKKSLSQKK